MEDCQTHSRCFGTDVVICRRMGLHHPQSCSKNQTSAAPNKAVLQSDPNARPISASAGSTKRACSLDCDGVGSHGLRIGEILALRWKYVDLCSHTLRVAETVYDGHFDAPKSQRSARIVPLAEEACSTLGKLPSSSTRPDDLVFSMDTGQPLDRHNLLRRQLRPTCEKLGLLGITWHSLRHYHATLLDAAGAPLGTVQSLLGHSASELTREVYLHAIPEDQRRAVANVEALLFGPKRTQIASASQTSA
jgi:hypothetical protein